MRIHFRLLLILAALGWNLTYSLAQAPCDSAPVFVSGPTLTCSGATGSYTLSGDPDAENYRWTLDGNEVSYSPDLFLDIEWTMPGMYQLCVEAVCSGSQTSPQECVLVDVNELNVVHPEPRLVCAPDTFGANAPGEYIIHLITPDGCDSVITLTIALYPEGPVDLGTIYLCEGDHWDLNGDLYSDPGNYTVEDYLPFEPWCYREMTFQIKAIDDAPISIHATYPKGKKGLPELRPAGIPPGLNEIYFWTGPNGFASSTKNIIAPDEGLYCLELTFSLNSDPGQTCSTQICYDTSPPLPPDTNEDPGPFDPDGKGGMKPWLYPIPTKDYLCLEWPGTKLEGNQFQLFNRWGTVVQSGSFSGSCVDLIQLPADIYPILVTLADGSKLKSWVAIYE